jgi:hypothetical protein
MIHDYIIRITPSAKLSTLQNLGSEVIKCAMQFSPLAGYNLEIEQHKKRA